MPGKVLSIPGEMLGRKGKKLPSMAIQTSEGTEAWGQCAGTAEAQSGTTQVLKAKRLAG